MEKDFSFIFFVIFYSKVSTTNSTPINSLVNLIKTIQVMAVRQFFLALELADYLGTYWVATHRANICLWNIHGTFPWDIPRIFSKKFPMKFWGIFRNNVLGILKIGIFPDCSMNILRMLHVIFFRWIKKYSSSFL